MARHLQSANSQVRGLYTYTGRISGDERSGWSTTSHEGIDIAGGYFGTTIRSRHSGLNRTASYNDSVEIKGRELANNRTVLVADACELFEIAAFMDLPIDDVVERTEAPIDHFMAGAMAINVLVNPSRVENSLKHYAQPSLKMFFGDPSDETSSGIWVNEFSTPCSKPAVEMKRRLDDIGIVIDLETLKTGFKAAAEKRRGWVAMPYMSGRISVGDQVYIEVPLDPKAHEGA